MNQSNGYVASSPKGLHLQVPSFVEGGWLYDWKGYWRLPKVLGYLGGVCGVHSPIWPKLTIFNMRIKPRFRTSYLGSFLNEAWYERVMIVVLLELLPKEARKHHKSLQPIFPDNLWIYLHVHEIPVALQLSTTWACGWGTCVHQLPALEKCNIYVHGKCHTSACMSWSVVNRGIGVLHVMISCQ